MAPKYECTQGERFKGIEKTLEFNSGTIKEMKDDLKEIKGIVTEIKENSVKEKDFSDFKQFQYGENKVNSDFRNNINIKIAYVSGGWAVFIAIVLFFMNKFFK